MDPTTIDRPREDVSARPRRHSDEDRYVEIHNLVKAYPNPTGDPVKVVDRFNLTIRKGEVVGVIGHSGCGKSTVLTMTAGLNAITSGSVIVGAKSPAPGPTVRWCSNPPACCPG